MTKYFEVDFNMPYWTWFEKSGCNYNGVDIFTSYQIGRWDIRMFKSIDTLKMWTE